MEQQLEPLKMPIFGENKISYRFNLPRCAICFNIISFILNVSTWIFLILIIITQIRIQEKDDLSEKEKDNEEVNSDVFLGLGAISYFLYFIFELNSKTTILLKLKDNKIINEKMGDIYKTNPSISLVAECYHNEGRGGTGGGSSVTVVSHKEEIPFNYTFCRDVSGNFNLNINKDNYKYKYYIILNIVYEVIFDDDSLFNDYNTIKNEIIERNKNKDKYFKYFDNIKLKEINNFMMINLQKKEPCFVGYFWNVIFNILSLASLYKLYIWLISISQTVTIRKIISRGNNNLPFDEKYDIYNPRLQFLDKTFTYDQNGNILENNNVFEYNNAQRNLPINDNQLRINSNYNMNDNNINNEQLNINNINIQVHQENSLSTERRTNISNQE